MSIDAYNRAIARESNLWTPFAFSFPVSDGQAAERVIIFGLYSNSSLNQSAYLMEIESTELTNLLNDYNTKLAELTTEQQVVVADIVSKRYLAGIDKLIHDQKMATKSAEISAEDATWTAKIAALAADQAALITLNTRVISETQKTNARIAELEAHIGLEAYNLSEVDMQITEKEIQSAKVDIEKLDTANAVLKIQMDTLRTAIELTDIDLQIARTKIESAHISRDMSRIVLLQKDLAVLLAQTQVAQSDLLVAASKVTLAGLKTTEISAEITFTNQDLVQQSQTELTNKTAMQNARQTLRDNELSQRKLDREQDMSERLAVADQDVAFAGADKTTQETMDLSRVSLLNTRYANLSQKETAAVDVAKTLAAANITSTLTHTIAKAT